MKAECKACRHVKDELRKLLDAPEAQDHIEGKSRKGAVMVLAYEAVRQVMRETRDPRETAWIFMQLVMAKAAEYASKIASGEDPFKGAGAPAPSSDDFGEAATVEELDLLRKMFGSDDEPPKVH